MIGSMNNAYTAYLYYIQLLKTSSVYNIYELKAMHPPVLDPKRAKVLIYAPFWLYIGYVCSLTVVIGAFNKDSWPMINNHGKIF